ncbi:MAG: hypothetical protein AAF997_17310 [Myxococcota bacterium]
MRRPRPTIVLLALSLAFGSAAFADAPKPGVRGWSEGSHRHAGNAERNRYRHPVETLTFFGVRPSSTVVEIWPSGGWYTEVLAPFLKDSGKYYAAGFALTAKRTPKWRKDMQRRFEAKLAERPDLYGDVVITELSVPKRM